MWTIHVTSNPYQVNYRTDEKGNIIVEYAVDQIWVDPDTNEQTVLRERFERIENEAN